jgi:transposase-like protein
MARRGYPPEFRRKVLDLLAAGRKVADVARDLELSDQTIYNWRRQDRIDRGLQAGLTTAETPELGAANRKIAALEAELAAAKRALELLEEVVPPKERYAAVRAMAADGHRVQLTCRLLGVAESGYYEWRDRPASARALRHQHLTETIRAVHAASRGTYGSRRVTAELVLGRGISVGHGQVELLMRRAGCTGCPAGNVASHQTRHVRRRSGETRLRSIQVERAVGHRHRAPRGAAEPCGGGRTPLAACRSRPLKAEDSLIPGTGVRAEAVLTTTERASTVRWPGSG